MPKQKYAYKFIQTKSYHTIPYRSWVESSWVNTASSGLKSDCATFCCAWQTLCVCVCVCVLSNIVYMGLSGLWSLDSDSDSEIWILFARPLLRPLCPLVASQSIVQMSKLHLLCASQKLKQIILPIAFWFRMSVTVPVIRWICYRGGGIWGADTDWLTVWGLGAFVGFIVRPQFMLIFVYWPPAASEIMQCLY